MKAADITLQQLGGRGRLKAMIGARDFFSENEGQTLVFKFSGCRKVNSLKVTLNGLDLYDVEFYKIGRYSINRPMSDIVKKVGGYDNVHAENLSNVIEGFTGLFLSLGTMGR